MPTDTDLIPRAVVDEIIESLGGESVAMRLGRSFTLPAGVAAVPLVSVLPQADFVATGERKPVGALEWTAEQLVPEEVAITTYLPQALFNDVGFDAESSVQSELAKAIAKRLDKAILFGDSPPPSYPPNGLVGAGTPVTGATASEALNAGFAAVEAEGLEVTGIAAGPVIGSALRTEYAAAAALPDVRPAEVYWGVPIARSPVWDSAHGDAIVGDWTNLLIGVAEELRFELSTDAILQDDAGEIVANAFQQDLVAFRCYARIGVAAANPVKEDGTASEATFVSVDWTP
jgi:hypothetical protein